jgi:hypothetical protein
VMPARTRTAIDARCMMTCCPTAVGTSSER